MTLFRILIDAVDSLNLEMQDYALDPEDENLRAQEYHNFTDQFYKARNIAVDFNELVRRYNDQILGSFRPVSWPLAPPLRRNSHEAPELYFDSLLPAVLHYAAADTTIVEPTDAFYVADYADILSTNLESYICRKNAALRPPAGARLWSSPSTSLTT